MYLRDRVKIRSGLRRSNNKERPNIFVFPTYYEGFGLALLEAMATGHACIVRDISAMEEVLGREAGILCSGVQELMEAVTELVSDSTK